jgi:hypothetical protein
MNRSVFFPGALLFFLMSCHPGPRPEDAVRFNDNLVMMQDTFYNQLDEIVTLISNEASSENILKKYSEILQYTGKSLQKIKEFPPFDTEDELRLASIGYFSSQLQMLENDFAAIMKLIQTDPAEITVEDQNAWDSLMNVIVIRDSLAIEKFLEEQEIFAKKYNIILREID